MTQTTLELILQGPMAGWCSDHNLRYRPTQQAPPMSAIVGLLACALGRDRTESLDDLFGLDIKVQNMATEPSRTMTDYHTLRDVITYDGKPGRAAITHREYVIQPSFQVLITGDTELLGQLAWAVQYPRWQLYLGRRSCPLSRPPFVQLSAV